MPIRFSGGESWDERISDEPRSKMEALLPKPKKHPLGCHRPRVPNRKAMNAIFFIPRTGARWNSLDAAGSGISCARVGG